MKKSFSRLLALLLAGAMVVSLAACGNSGSNSSDSGDSADSGDGIVIGCIGPFTGSTAAYGNAVKNACELAVDEINEAGGVNGMKLILKSQDDENDPEKAANAYNTLKDQGMQALVGTVTSTPCVAVGELSYADNMFQITPSGTAVDCTQYDNCFRVCFNDPNQGTVSAKYIKDHNLASKVAVIYDSSDVYSSGIYEKFASEAKEEGIEVVEAQAFTSDNKTDFSVQLQKVQSSGAELLFLPIYYQEAALIIEQANSMDLNMQIFGCDGLDGIIAQLGDKADLAEGVMLLTAYAADSTDEKSQAFTQAYEDAFDGEVPNQFAADAYDAVYAIKAALEDAGVDDPNISASDLCDLLVSSMTKITVDGVTGSMTWSADGEPTKDAKAMVIKDGGYSALD